MPEQHTLKRIIPYQEFIPSLEKLRKRGGVWLNCAEKVYAAVDRFERVPTDGFRLPCTNHGESRAAVTKYDIGHGARLVAERIKDTLLLLYAGRHEDVDSWLDRNRGRRWTISADGEIGTTVHFDEGVLNPADSRPVAMGSGPLLNRLDLELQNDLLAGESAAIFGQVYAAIAADSPGAIRARVGCIADRARRDAVFDVLMLLRRDDLQGAITRTREFLGLVVPVDDAPPEELPDIIDRAYLRSLKTGTSTFARALKRFLEGAEYREWMLYLHPDQEGVVERDFPGPATLAGVSGSGKTCVVVQRAVRLAQRYTRERILILTLNPSLSRLIRYLVQACADEDVTARIDVKPFFEVCQDLLKKFEPGMTRHYLLETWKHDEHVDEIWHEFYLLRANNYDARVLQPVHDYLLAQNWNAQRYIREEFDWIRSALPWERLDEYYQIERSGRAVPFQRELREHIIAGLKAWREKMEAVGVIDNLGIAQAVQRHSGRIGPQWRCILVDEAQDFGNLELGIVRRLVAAGENDLFLCGDASQAVTTKYQCFSEIGVRVPSQHRVELNLNFRNSRDVLAAAFAVLETNMTEAIMDREDFKILHPRFSATSGATPMLASAATLAEEVGYALHQIRDYLRDQPGRKGCLAFCGFTLLEVSRFARAMRLPLLDGNADLAAGDLFVSDLEQSKGFEFDIMCIVNCSARVMPDPQAPADEQYRDLSRLYVAMTRARRQLIVSYSGAPSPYLVHEQVQDKFLHEPWRSFLPESVTPARVVPEALERSTQAAARAAWRELSGEKFLYLPEAVGLNRDLIARIRELVDGRGLSRGRQRLKWARMGEAVDDVRAGGSARVVWGPQSAALLLELATRLEAPAGGQQRVP